MGYRELIKKVQHYSGFSDQESKRALEQTVEALAGRLTADERKDFASQLPSELQEVALSAHTVDKKSKADLIGDFMQRQNIRRDRAKKQLLAAWQALKDAITKGEIEDIKAQLPKSASALLY